MKFSRRSDHSTSKSTWSTPKVPKTFNSIPPFPPTIDTTGTNHYSVGKYLSKLLNPLTQNMYTVKDSLDAANRINKPNSTYCSKLWWIRLVSLDVVSLFTSTTEEDCWHYFKTPLYWKRNYNYTYEEIFKEINFRHLSKSSFLLWW